MKGENKQLSVQNLEKAVQIVPEYRTVPFCSIRQAARCVTGLLKILLRHAAKTGVTTFFFSSQTDSNTNFWAQYFDAYIILKKNNEIEIFFLQKPKKKL